MRHFYSSALAGAILLTWGTSVKADWDYWGVKHTGSSGGDNIYGIYTINSKTGTSTFRNQIQTPTGMNYDESYTNSSEPNKLILDVGKTNLWEYDLDSDSWTELTNVTNWRGNMDGEFNKLLITKSSNGVTSIGKNSLKLKETTNSQEMWATNESGEIAPINITNGTKLLINGRDVEQAIDNVGALSAALTGLPTVPQDSPMACGIGTGTHSNNVAFSGGCASRINEKLAFNVAASFVPGQSYQGNFENAWSGRAGFVFKLGKVNKPSLVSTKGQEDLQAMVKDLRSKNETLQSKVDSFESEKSELFARLGKLERIALANQSDQKTTTSFFNISNLFSTMRSFLISSN